jgi:hypothetical protein
MRTGTTTEIPLVFEPHKCVFGVKQTSVLYCGYEITQYGSNFPDDWYKGTRSFSDRIWRVDLNTSQATQLVNPVQASGREVDIIDMTLSADEKSLYFRNKNNNTLWQYNVSN